MKNKIFALLLVAFAGTIRANDDAAQLAVALARVGTEVYAADQNHKQSLPTEQNFRRQLYWLSKNNPLFYKLDDYKKNLDYYIAVLTAHVKVLEDKEALKANGLGSKGLRTGATCSVLAALNFYGAYYFLLLRQTALADARLSFSSKAQKSGDAMFAAVVFGCMAAAFAAVAGNKFYKVSRYAERINERLERDKELLAALEAEKAVLDSKKIDSPTEAALINVLNSIVNAVNSVIQGPVADTAV
jgi:hypothetical protein